MAVKCICIGQLNFVFAAGIEAGVTYVGKTTVRSGTLKDCITTRIQWINGRVKWASVDREAVQSLVWVYRIGQVYKVEGIAVAAEDIVDVQSPVAEEASIIGAEARRYAQIGPQYSRDFQIRICRLNSCSACLGRVYSRINRTLWYTSKVSATRCDVDLSTGCQSSTFRV